MRRVSSYYMLPGWLRHGAFDVPAVCPQALHQREIRQSPHTSPFRDSPRFSRIGIQHISTGVVALLPRRRPTAITGNVANGIIDAVKRIARRTVADIPEKCGEVCAPNIGHSQAAPAVSRIFRIVHVVTATLRAFPSAMFARSTQAMRPTHLALNISQARG